jgi:DNA-binding transcriptional LysR family regulator
MRSLQNLAVFEQVARLGSMSRAAASLRLSQPTVSARVSALEAELGVTLFRRVARGSELTPAGRRFLGYAERCLALYAEGANAARSEGERRELRMAAPASLAEAVFAELANALVVDGFDVALSTGHSPQVLELVQDGRADVGICGVGPTMTSLVAVRLPALAIVCVAAADHPLAAQSPGSFDLAEVARHRLAVFEWHEDVDDLLEHVRFAAGVGAVTGFIKVSPAGVAQRLLEQGAVSWLPEMLVRADVARGTLAILEPTGVPDYRWELMLVHRVDASGDDRIVSTLAHARRLLAPVVSSSRPADEVSAVGA